MKASRLSQRRTSWSTESVRLSSRARPLDGDILTRSVEREVLLKISFPVVSQGPASESVDILPSGFPANQIRTVIWEGASWFSDRI